MTLPGENDKAIVLYVTDTGAPYTIIQKRTMAQAVGNIILDIQQLQGVPERWKLRHVYLGTVYGGRYFRRKVIIGNPNSNIFAGSQSFLLIDGVQWRILERKGESRRGPHLSH